MKDRELLEFATKAAGIEIHESDDGTLQKRPIWAVTHFVCGQPYGESQWNPLTDDGDALRLAVKLSIDVYFGEDDGPATYAGWYGSEANTQRQRYAVERHNADPYAATRRAIVRAAAEIGKGMQ